MIQSKKHTCDNIPCETCDKRDFVERDAYDMCVCHKLEKWGENQHLVRECEPDVLRMCEVHRDRGNTFYGWISPDKKYTWQVNTPKDVLEFPVEDDDRWSYVSDWSKIK